METSLASLMPPELTMSSEGKLQITPRQFIDIQKRFRAFYHCLARTRPLTHSNIQTIYHSKEDLSVNAEVVDEICQAWSIILEYRDVCAIAYDAIPELRAGMDTQRLSVSMPVLPTPCFEANRDHLERTELYTCSILPAPVHDHIIEYVRQIMGVPQAAVDASRSVETNSNDLADIDNPQFSFSIDDYALADRAFMKLSAMYQMIENDAKEVSPILKKVTDSYRALRRR